LNSSYLLFGSAYIARRPGPAPRTFQRRDLLIPQHPPDHHSVFAGTALTPDLLLTGLELKQMTNCSGTQICPERARRRASCTGMVNTRQVVSETASASLEGH